MGYKGKSFGKMSPGIVDMGQTDPAEGDENGKSAWEGVWARAASSPETLRRAVGVEERSRRFKDILGYLAAAGMPVKGLRTIELGSGRGTVSLLLAARGADVTLVDSSPAALESARRLFSLFGLKADFLMSGILPLPEQLKGKFDAAMSFGVAEHFTGKERGEIFISHSAALRPGGVVFISVPNRNCFPYRIWKKAKEAAGTWEYGTEIPFSRTELLEMGAGAGLLKVAAPASGFIDALDKFSLYGALSRLGVDTQASSALDAGLGYALTLYGVKGGAVEEGSARVGKHPGTGSGKGQGLLKLYNYYKKYKNWTEILFFKIFKKSPAMVVLRNGLKIYTGGDISALTIIEEIFFSRVYNPVDFEIRPGDIVVDIGANIGVFTLFAALRTEKKVYAFEPFPGNCRLLKANLSVNAIGNVQCETAAISDKEGVGKLFLGSISGGHLLFDLGAAKTQGRSVEVKTTTLKKTMDENGIDRIDLLKIDCEGSEGAILSSLPKEYLNRINRIVMEFHDNVSSLKHGEIESILDAAGFTTSIRWDGRSFFGYVYAIRSRDTDTAPRKK